MPRFDAHAGGSGPVHRGLRISATGRCDLRRSCCLPEQVALWLRGSVWGKLPGHGVNGSSLLRPTRSMSMIGA